MLSRQLKLRHAGIEARNGLSNDGFFTMADFDGSGKVTNQDIQPLLDMIENGGDSLVAPPPSHQRWFFLPRPC